MHSDQRRLQRSGHQLQLLPSWESPTIWPAFLLDVPYQLGRDVNTYFPAYRQWEFFAFGGDKWQVSPKLTVNLGVRWEFYPPATPQFPGGFSNYDPTTNNLVIAGVGSNPSNLGMKTRYNYFAPRVGPGLPPDGKDRDPRGLRHQLHAVPGQYLRLQLSRALQQLLHQRGRRLRDDAAADRPAGDLPAGLPAAGAGGDSLQRHHPGHGIAASATAST